MTAKNAPNGTGIRRIRLLWSLFLKERSEPEPFYQALGAEAAFDLEKRYGIQGHRILDVGCGPGWYAEAMRKHGATVLGIDGDMEVLTRAQPPISGLMLGDATLMAFPDNSFDGVFCSNMLEHTSSPSMVVDEIIRVLKPGGWGLPIMDKLVLSKRRAQHESLSISRTKMGSKTLRKTPWPSTRQSIRRRTICRSYRTYSTHDSSAG